MLLATTDGWAQGASPPPESDPTIMGMSYGHAALVTAAVVAGAVAINTFVAPNVGTLLGALYVGHLVAEAVVVVSGAGASWGLGWWDDAPAEAPPPIK